MTVCKAIFAIIFIAGIGGNVRAEAADDDEELNLPKGLELFKEDDAGTAMRKLLKGRYNEALLAMSVQQKIIKNEHFDPTQLCSMLAFAGNAADSFDAISDNSSERIAVLTGIVEYLRRITNAKEQRYEIGASRWIDVHTCRYYLADAEIRLLRLKEPGIANTGVDAVPTKLELLKEDAGDSPMRKLLKARYNATVPVINTHQVNLDNQKLDINDLQAFLAFHLYLADSLAAIYDKPSQQIAVLSAIHERLKGIEAAMKKRYEVGSLKKQDYYIAIDYCRDAEIRLAEATQPDAAKIARENMLKISELIATSYIKQIKENYDDSAMHKLFKARYNAEFTVFEMCRRVFEIGSWDINRGLFDSYPRIAYSLAAMPLQPADRVAILGPIVESMQQVEKSLQKRFQVGSLRKYDLYVGQYMCLDAEIRLAQAKETKR